MKIINYIWGIIIHPDRTLRALSFDESRMKYSLVSVVIFAASYSIGALISYLRGILPLYWEPLVRIPREQFFLWESVYLVPITIVTWVCLAGFAQLFAGILGGSGTFEDTLVLTGLPLIVLLPGMFIPDAIVQDALPREIVGSFVFMKFINPFRLFAGSIWVLAVHILAVQRAQGLPLRKSTLVTLLAYVPYMALTITYVH